jgi:hypothetical protein
MPDVEQINGVLDTQTLTIGVLILPARSSKRSKETPPMFHPSAQDRIRRWLAAAVITATAMIALAASPALAQVATLGSPPPEAEASSAPAEELSEHDAMLAYAECMRDSGVEVTDPIFDDSGNLVGGLEFERGKDAAAKDTKSEDFQVATEACGDFLVAFKPALDPALQAEQTEAALRFATCMREQGLDWPDPAPDGTKFAGAEIKIDKKSAEFQAAYGVCDEELAPDAVEPAEE